MKLSLYTDDLREASVDLVALGVFSDEPDRGLAFSQLNAALNGVLAQACKDEDFKGKAGQTVVVNVAAPGGARRVMVYGYGPRDQYTAESARRFAGTAAKVARKVGAATAALQLAVFDAPDDPESVLMLVQALAEGVELGYYRFDTYRRRETSENRLEEVHVAFAAEDVQGLKGAALRDAMRKGQRVATAVAFARDLINSPPNDLTPNELADRARAMAKKNELACKVLSARDLERQKMRLHLGVGQGSRNEPRLIHLTYTPDDKNRSDRVVCLVGKGITFDAGGLSLKTSEGMMDMKIDMGGAAAVLGAMEAVALTRPGCVVHGIVGAAENMPDGNAIRPGDVIEGKKGITVEVLNTDAEGRLVLADALAYAQELKPTDLIDLATLTGACMVALGRLTAAAFTDHEDMASDLQAAWVTSGESFWRMPLNPELQEQLKSDIADIKNIGERWGGAITAALFLKAFVEEGTRWAHLDIAGPVSAAKDQGHIQKGGTGFGVRTLLAYIERVSG